MRAKLSPSMLKALTALSDGNRRGSYGLHVSLSTLQALRDRGLVTARHGLGSMAFPHTSIEWRITNTGLAALRGPPAARPEGCCNICGTKLNVPEDPTSGDCGGDCLRCMAEIGEDPDCIRSMRALGHVAKRDGSPMPTSQDEEA